MNLLCRRRYYHQATACLFGLQLYGGNPADPFLNSDGEEALRDLERWVRQRVELRIDFLAPRFIYRLPGNASDLACHC
jgi:hypothetical protein